MTEVKNNSLDLMNLQFSSGQKKNTGSNSVDDLGGFKTMLKDKNQRPDHEPAKAPDKKRDDSEPAVENAAAVMAKPEPQTRDVAPEEAETGQGLTTDSVLPGEGVTLLTGLWEEGQTGGQFQTLDQLRFKQLMGAQNDIQTPEAVQAPEFVLQNEEVNLHTEAMADLEVTSMPGENLHLEESSSLENVAPPDVQKQQPKAPLAHMAVKEAKNEEGQDDLSNISRVEVRTLEETANTYEKPTESTEQTEKVNVFEVHEEQKNALSGTEEKLPEESAAAVQEKPFEQMAPRLKTSKEQHTVYTTVKVDSQEDLEAKLSEQLLKQIQSGRKELEVQLEPVNLGKIRIKVSYDDNHVSVSVLCTESKTLKALSQTAGDLGSILESNLERPVQILVDKQENDYLSNQQHEEGRQQQQQQKQNQEEKDSSDFLQKLRLGILDTNVAEESYLDYR